MSRNISEWLECHRAAGADLRINSKDIQPGDVFIACKGSRASAEAYVLDAIARGAAAALIEGSPKDDAASWSIPVRYVSELPAQLGSIADQWYGHPSSQVRVVAVTGTNGKTSCASWLAQALNKLGMPCASIGTLGMVLPDGEQFPTGLTTPDVVNFHRLLHILVLKGIGTAVVEASSIGIDQGRLDGIQVEIAAFTNLSQDHLDYHRDMADYEAAKAALFKRPELRAAVINLDDPAGRRLCQALASGCCLTYSTCRAEADVVAEEHQHTAEGMSFRLHIGDQQAWVNSQQIGAHNLSNLLLTAAVLHQMGFGHNAIAEALAALAPVPGRLQSVNLMLQSQPDNNEQLPWVLVDYAHTPDALSNVLRSLHPLRRERGGRLICVFGCGGDRDRRKRPLMAQAALQDSDYVYLTSDNPRSEDPQEILQEMARGLQAGNWQSDPDRACSILEAILLARPEDVIIIAGKGHETYQEVQGKRQHFDDRQWALLGLLMRQKAPVSTDTRRIHRGDIFLALKGERFDAHDFLDAAKAAGALAAVIEQDHCPQGLLGIRVHDTLKALQTMARAWRRQFRMPLMAVVGSNGKTTTKEMIAAILNAASGQGEFFATPGNLNNHIGVPLSLLQLRSQHRFVVMELGMNHPGEIAQLADMVRPTAAVLTNAQREHQEFMKSVEAVARENGAVFEHLSPDGIAVFPADSPWTPLWQKLAGSHRQFRFGWAEEADSSASQPAQAAGQRPAAEFIWHWAGQRCPVELTVPGLHNICNALAAATVCGAVGIEPECIVRGLRSFRAVKGRMQALPGKFGIQVIDDTYNANPDSVEAAIDVLARCAAPRLLVLGDMAEVGEDSPHLHAEAGAYAAAQGIDWLFALGSQSRHAAEAFGAQGRFFHNIDALQAAVDQLRPATVLVKGSRSMRMERVVQHLMSAEAT